MNRGKEGGPCVRSTLCRDPRRTGCFLQGNQTDVFPQGITTLFTLTTNLIPSLDWLVPRASPDPGHLHYLGPGLRPSKFRCPRPLSVTTSRDRPLVRLGHDPLTLRSLKWARYQC